MWYNGTIIHRNMGDEMNQNYNEIMNLLGADEIKDLVKKWEVLSENISDINSRPSIILPDLLWVMNSGVGRTRILNLLAEYLNSKRNLVDFYGDTKCFEFLLNYCYPEQPFEELQRFMDAVQNAAGFRSEFRGIVCIDIDEWIEHYEEKHFVSFLELLACHREDWLIVLSIQENVEKLIMKLHSYLSAYLRLERINLGMPNNEEIIQYVCDKLAIHGLSMSHDNMEKLNLTIEKIRESVLFDGFKTLNMLYQDIAYEHFCESGAGKGEIGDNTIAKFTVDSEYVKKLICTDEKTHTIGFSLEGE